MQIGQLARQAGVAVDTVRYYERSGLLAAPPRRPSGYRSYADADLDRLRLIRRGKELGFTLEEIRELLRLTADASADRGQVRALVSRRLADVDRQLVALRAVRETLAGLESSCSGTGPVAGCPIIAQVLHVPPGKPSHAPGAESKVTGMPAIRRQQTTTR